jgi:hypothetical protein
MHVKHVLIAYCLFPMFSLSVDRGSGVEIDYTDAPYYYPAEQGKRSPTF